MINRLVLAQIAVALALAAGLALTLSAFAGYSALVGGLVAVLPNYYFAGRLMSRSVATPEQSLRQIYVGEFLKIAFTVSLIVIAIKALRVDFLIMMLTYAAAVIVNWLALLVVNLSEAPEPQQPEHALNAKK